MRPACKVLPRRHAAMNTSSVYALTNVAAVPLRRGVMIAIVGQSCSAVGPLGAECLLFPFKVLRLHLLYISRPQAWKMG